ncbi:hypothetical protein EXIGLDRAFT_760412 [Exidia glandulosa HHB12029]|uniref:BZIP domain-containing protein n=1 Tax=Exidia glandulosa HHB12029 TaxID=1314781 RepID=A0A165P8Q2_EXIGL|nr:hypothetical protein EXIGLDRAFT_760412 [Exidia glandulosa HHB12029]
MPSSSLQGLNMVDFPSPSGDNTALAADLAAQLDLWSTLTFSTTDSDPLPGFGGLGSKASTLDDLVRLGEEELAHEDSHQHHHSTSSTHQTTKDMDFAKLFGFPGSSPGVDPFVVSPQATVGSGSSSEPPAKKARARKQSVSVSVASPDDDKDGEDDGTPVTAAEDKRRRNTAASARFRAKKKEREAALERRAKELEVRVGELERECEALRRENGWLKGLVVGVTQAGGDVGVGVSAGGSGKRKRESQA